MKIITLNGENLTSYRLKSGLSMRQLAHAADIDILTVHRIESGKTKKITPSTARKICEALGTAFDEIFIIKEAQ